MVSLAVPIATKECVLSRPDLLPQYIVDEVRGTGSTVPAASLYPDQNLDEQILAAVIGRSGRGAGEGSARRRVIGGDLVRRECTRAEWKTLFARANERPGCSERETD